MKVINKEILMLLFLIHLLIYLIWNISCDIAEDFCVCLSLSVFLFFKCLAFL